MSEGGLDANNEQNGGNAIAYRFSVGIDLGTTHCVLSYLDLQAEGDEKPHKMLAIPQLTSPGNIEDKLQLPSFIYQAHESELSLGDVALPWNAEPDVILGAMARDLGSKTPIRLVASAKSWLCHGTIDTRSAILPFNSPEEVEKVSPFDATYRYLQHLSDAWDYQFPETPLVDQDVTITVPASFDPAARELTAEAAQKMGFHRLTLLEEPQAAVYSWIKNSADGWREQVSVGDIVLVVDVGGGTTDLSLIAVTEKDGDLVLNRVAVGEHILLGGDNMDLALAYVLRNKLAQQGKKLQAWQVMALTHACRDAKETLLSDPEIDSVQIAVPSRGSKLLGGTIRTELTREEVTVSLVAGFFPEVGIDEHPQQQARSALSEGGLPYAQDAGITRHLAAFLSRQCEATKEVFENQADDQGFIKPTVVLLNGGVLKAPVLSQRLLDIINQWLQKAGAEKATLLEGLDLDLAVASGAAYYGFVRHGKGVRIKGGIASAYYVGIESAMPAVPGMEPPMQGLCVAPFGMEEGAQAEVSNRNFHLLVGEPVKFRFYGSTTRREDSVGSVLDDWDMDELTELPEIQADLPIEGRQAGDRVPVTLASRVTEVGTLCLEAIATDGCERWQVELDVRQS